MRSFMNRGIVRALTRRAGLTRAVLAAGFVVLSTAACDVHGISEPGTITQIVVSPDPQSMVVNGTMQFTAVGMDYEGRTVPMTEVWSVASGGGTISSTGLFTAGTSTGTFTRTVTATNGSLSGTATVVVTAGPLANITVTPDTARLGIGLTQQFTAVGTDAGGNVVPLTPTWSIAAGGGTVNNTGLFTAGSATGTFGNTVRVSSGGLSATATVIVTPGPLASIDVTPDPTELRVGRTQQLTAVGRDASGNVVAITPVWSVVAGGGTVNAVGMFTAGTTPGTYENTARATSGGLSGTATVIVTSAPLATITVTPDPATLDIGGTQQFTAVGRDASGNVVQITPTWSVVAGGGTVGGTGLFTAGTTAGTYTNTVRATSGGISGAATVIVTPSPLTAIIVTPDPATLAIGDMQRFRAVGRDASGAEMDVTPTWTVVAGGGTISTGGVFTAGATPGTYTRTVRASVEGVDGFATVIVTSAPVAPVATITVTPNPATLEIGGTQQFTAVGRDANGNTVTITPVWSVVASGGTVSGTGLFTAGNAAGTYNNTVRATSGGISGGATVIVTAAPLASITVSPNPGTVLTNGTLTFTAVGRDGDNTILPITPVWSVVAGGGTINASTGVFTAGTVAGNFPSTIRATSGTVSGFATVNVTIVPTIPTLATITVTPSPASMPTSDTQQFTAVGRDQNGNIFPISPQWSVENGGGTIHSTTGLFTAGALAGTFENTVEASQGAISGSATVTVTAVLPPPTLVDLGAAAPNGIMAGASVTCVIGGIINADVSISPGNTLTGFGPCVINGVTHLGDAVAAQGQIALTNAYNTLAGLPCPPANAIVADLGGTTKAAGVYCSATSIGVTGPLTLDGGGDPNATFVFQAGTSLTTAGSVILINGAKAENVYWQVGSSATLGTASQWQGNILALTSISLVDNAVLIGRALARNGSVTLGTNNVITLP